MGRGANPRLRGRSCNSSVIAANLLFGMQTAVIIVSFNTCAPLLRCLETIVGTAPICVVDNASTDGSVAAVRARFPEVGLLALPTNQGFSVAVNAGARALGGDYLLLLNPDTEVPPGGIASMQQVLLRHPHAAAVGFRQVDASGAFQLAAGPYPSFWAEAARRAVQRRLDADHPWMGRLMDRLLSRPRSVAWVAGSSMLVRRAAFDHVGGFDEGFFLYFEDIDFCLRLRAEVGRVYYDPSVTIVHHRGLSAATAPVFARRAYRTSQLRFGETSRAVGAPLRGVGAAHTSGGLMRRVMHVMASGARGGGAQHLLGLLPLQQASGMAVSALVGNDGPLAEQLIARGVATTVWPLMDGRWDRRWLGWLEGARERAQPDLMHYHGSRAGFWGGCFRMVQSVQRSVYTAHGLACRVSRPMLSRPLFGLAETVACRADAVISVSQADLHVLIARHGLAARRGHHIGNAIDGQRRQAGDKAAARQRLDLPQNVPLIGCVARLTPQKGVGDLLDAVHDVPNAHVVVVGDGPLASRLARHPLVALGRAHLLGSRDDVPLCLPAFDLFALSSHWEGEPIALLEAMACGLPCVATRTSGASELLRHNVSGYLVDVGNPAQLACALRKLLGDAATCRRLGAQAFAFAEARSYPRVCAQVMAVYAKVLGDADLQQMAQEQFAAKGEKATCQRLLATGWCRPLNLTHVP